MNSNVLTHVGSGGAGVADIGEWAGSPSHTETNTNHIHTGTYREFDKLKEIGVPGGNSCWHKDLKGR